MANSAFQLTTGGATCDYEPYCFTTNADDPETEILALSPFAYHRCDEGASGTLVDYSGNANHGVIGGSVSGGSGLSAKTTDHLNLVKNSGYAAIDTPTGTGLGTDSVDFAIAALVQIDDISGTSNGFPVWFNHTSSGADYDIIIITDQNGGSFAGHEVFTRNSFGAYIPLNWITLGTPFVYVINGPDAAAGYATGAASSWEFWINGSLVTSAIRHGTGTFTAGVRLGQANDTFWGSPTMKVGPIASWSRELDPSEIKTVTEVLMDSTIASGAYVP